MVVVVVMMMMKYETPKSMPHLSFALAFIFCATPPPLQDLQRPPVHGLQRNVVGANPLNVARQPLLPARWVLIIYADVIRTYGRDSVQCWMMMMMMMMMNWWWWWC